jgi:alkylation response protein AidB-like acyl-CoA dehydrogenase
MQVHGGIGYTWEADLQLWMKKSWALMRAYGDATFHRRRVGASILSK